MVHVWQSARWSNMHWWYQWQRVRVTCGGVHIIGWLLHPKSSWDSPSSQWLCYGFWTSVNSAIPFILFCSSSCLLCLLIHPQTLFPPTFHVSELQFVSCFHSTLHFCSLCSIFWTLNPDPDISPILITLICPLLIYICSELHVCSSVWNRHWLSLWTLVWNSRTVGV